MTNPEVERAAEVMRYCDNPPVAGTCVTVSCLPDWLRKGSPPLSDALDRLAAEGAK